MLRRTTTKMPAARADQDITIQVSRNFKGIRISPSKLRKLIETVCLRFGANKGPKSNVSEAGYEISIAIVDDAGFQRTNKEFLNHSSISDCLSFDLSDSEPGSPKTFELVINGQMALRQAGLRGHKAEAELALYVTHALLHNFGFDDTTETLARKMHRKEDEILQELGYGFVYNKNMDSNTNREKRKYKK